MCLKIKLLTTFGSILALLAFIAPAKPAHAQGYGNTITCSSDDGRRNFCNADTQGGVQLTRQISGSACIQGQTWGWNNNQIWVDKGCRAEFRTSNGNNWGGGWDGNNASTVTCSSDDGRRNFCNANTRGGVQLTRQISGSPCIQGQTWGWNNNQIWVDKGCRAEFATGNGNGSGWGNGGGWGGGNGSTITCSSDDGRRNFCNANTWGGIQLTRQISGSACIQGQTWGWNNNQIWVDKGCRAEFRTGNGNWGGSWSGNNGTTITCSSDDGRRNFCNANTRGGVQLTRQISGSPCVQGQTWGWNNNQIWVDKGCRAEFATGRGNGNGWGNGGGWGGNNGNVGTTFNCSSDDGKRHYCAVPNGVNPASVMMTRQISGSACIQGQTWGADGQGVWVDKGCRAEFRTNQ